MSHLNSASSKLFNRLVAATLSFAALLAFQSAQAANYYWDSNGATLGAGVTPNGTWGTDPFWSTASAGNVATTNATTTTADTVRFSAGSDTVGAYSVTVNGTQSALLIYGISGNVTFTGGTLSLGTSTSSSSFVTQNTTSMTVNSTVSVTNGNATSNYLGFTPNAGTTITVNGPVTATLPTNRIDIRNIGAGIVNIDTNLGNDATFKSAFQLGGIRGALGTLNLNGVQTLGTTQVISSDATRIGTVNLGSTVNLGNAVQVGDISIAPVSATGNMTGAIINVNSAVTATTLNLRSGGTLNVGGSLTASGAATLGLTTDTIHGATMKVLNGGTAALTTVNVRDGSVLTNAGTLTGTTLTLGNGTTSGTLVLGDATGAGTATVTQLTTSGTGTSNAIVGGNSAVSSLTVNASGASTFGGQIGGAGANENNVALVKQGASSLTLSGLNTYTGNTTVSLGTLILADNAALNFAIGTTGVNNAVGGTGTLTLDGDFTFDLTSAAGLGSWNIVDVANLTANFGATFTVVGFADAGGNKWTNTIGASTYTFDEATGILTAVPEPATWALLAGAGTFFMVMRRRRFVG